MFTYFSFCSVQAFNAISIWALTVSEWSHLHPCYWYDGLACTGLLLRLAHCAALIGWRHNIKFRSDSSLHWLTAAAAAPPLPLADLKEPLTGRIYQTSPALFPLLRLPKLCPFLSTCTMKERRLTQPFVARCKLVLVGDVQCGKTAMLQVLVKDCYPEVRGLILEKKRKTLLIYRSSLYNVLHPRGGIKIYKWLICISIL